MVPREAASRLQAAGAEGSAASSCTAPYARRPPVSAVGTGDGRIAIHGTNQPSSIGQAVSNGCPHVPDDVVLELVDFLPLGTPATITP